LKAQDLRYYKIIILKLLFEHEEDSNGKDDEEMTSEGTDLQK